MGDANDVASIRCERNSTVAGESDYRFSSVRWSIVVVRGTFGGASRRNLPPEIGNVELGPPTWALSRWLTPNAIYFTIVLPEPNALAWGIYQLGPHSQALEAGKLLI